MTLSPTTIATVKATIPLLQEKGVKITQRMYEILFARHPELKALFKDAPEDQPNKLAAAVCAYALHIDRLEALSEAVTTMAKAHVRAGVQPEHYPKVGEALLSAMQEVLAEAATPQVLNAWKEAFSFLAEVLIAKEKALYANAA